MKPILTLALCSAAVLSGCASHSASSKDEKSAQPQNSVEALKTWDDAYGNCIQQAKTSQYAFPKDNQWFNSLGQTQKKNLVVYLYQEKMYGCSADETMALKQALTNDGNDTLLKFFTSVNVFEKPNTKLIEGVDQQQISAFAKQVPVFNLAYAAKQLNF